MIIRVSLVRSLRLAEDIVLILSIYTHVPSEKSVKILPVNIKNLPQ